MFCQFLTIEKLTPTRYAGPAKTNSQEVILEKIEAEAEVEAEAEKEDEEKETANLEGDG